MPYRLERRIVTRRGKNRHTDVDFRTINKNTVEKGHVKTQQHQQKRKTRAAVATTATVAITATKETAEYAENDLWLTKDLQQLCYFLHK